METGLNRAWIPCLAALAFACSVPSPAAEAGSPERRRTWAASVILEADHPVLAATRTVALAERYGGRVENRTDGAGAETTLHLLLPAGNFTDVLAALETAGTVVSRQVETKDVSASYAEAEAQLNGRLARRDRLRALLDRTAAADDALAVESELNQAQADVDAAQARLQSYKVRIDWGIAILAFDSAPETRKPILGPLGYLFKGLFWSAGKLFVIRDGASPKTAATGAGWAEPPLPPPRQTAPGDSALLQYVVQEGDTLEGIGRLFVVTADDLRRANPGIGARDVFPGEAISIPSAQ
ncbi:MAG: DUF4349 domain-containing protein [Kiritimatiellia bacterium]